MAIILSTFIIAIADHCSVLINLQIMNRYVQLSVSTVTSISVCDMSYIAQHWEDCALYPIVCPKGCGAKISRTSLDKHFGNWCPWSIIDCEFEYAGWEVRIRRKCMKSHLDEDVKDH